MGNSTAKGTKLRSQSKKEMALVLARTNPPVVPPSPFPKHLSRQPDLPRQGSLRTLTLPLFYSSLMGRFPVSLK